QLRQSGHAKVPFIRKPVPPTAWLFLRLQLLPLYPAHLIGRPTCVEIKVRSQIRPMVQGLDDAHGAARVLKAPQNRIQPLYRIRDSLLFGRESRLAPLFQLRLAALVRNLRKHPKSTDAYMV